MTMLNKTSGYFRWFSYLLINPLTTYLEVIPTGYLGGIAQKALAARKANPDARFDMAAYWFRGLERIKAEPDSAMQSRHWNEIVFWLLLFQT